MKVGPEEGLRPPHGGTDRESKTCSGTIELRDAYQAELSKLLAYVVVAFSGFLVGLQLVLTSLTQPVGRLPFRFAALILLFSNAITLFFGAVAIARYDLIAWIEEREETHRLFDDFGQARNDGLTRWVSSRLIRMEWALYGNKGASKNRILGPLILGVLIVGGLWLGLFRAYTYGPCLPGITC